MTCECEYSITKRNDGFSIDRMKEPSLGPVAFIKPTLGRDGEPTGWRLKPRVAMQGQKRRIWATAAEAIASTKLLTLAAARRAVEDANSLAAGSKP